AEEREKATGRRGLGAAGGFLLAAEAALATIDMGNPAANAANRASLMSVDAASHSVSGPMTHGEDSFLLSQKSERAAQCDLIRCIFGNPLNPASLDLNSLPSTVKKIAQTIYDERQFENLPILADALEDAGCDNADILSHCRSPGPHVRGCWLVDLILEKK